jgi:hypothetical protein
MRIGMVHAVVHKISAAYILQVLHDIVSSKANAKTCRIKNCAHAKKIQGSAVSKDNFH